MTIEEIWEESSYGEAVQAHARKKMAREMAQLALEDHFGALNEDILAAMKGADEVTLKSLVTAKSLEQVRERLGLSQQTDIARAEEDLERRITRRSLFL